MHIRLHKPAAKIVRRKANEEKRSCAQVASNLIVESEHPACNELGQTTPLKIKFIGEGQKRCYAVVEEKDGAK